MYEDIVKNAQDSLKPVLKLAETNTALAINLLKSQSEKAASQLEANLAHAQALVASKDLNDAVELQQQYIKTLGDSMVEAAKENAAVIESAMGEMGKVVEGSFSEAQAQVEKIAKEAQAQVEKVTKAAAPEKKAKKTAKKAA